MRASGTFKVVAFTPASTETERAAACGLTAAATLEKKYEGDIAGRSATLLATDFDQRGEVGACEDGGGNAADLGADVAMEMFEGTVGGRNGAFGFAHSRPDTTASSSEESIRILPASGTGRLAGIRGTGGMTIDADGTHRVWLDYELD